MQLAPSLHFLSPRAVGCKPANLQQNTLEKHKHATPLQGWTFSDFPLAHRLLVVPMFKQKKTRYPGVSKYARRTTSTHGYTRNIYMVLTRGGCLEYDGVTQSLSIYFENEHSRRPPPCCTPHRSVNRTLPWRQAVVVPNGAVYFHAHATTLVITNHRTLHFCSDRKPLQLLRSMP